jgi:5'-methylthioadenosine phosphorylase
MEGPQFSSRGESLSYRQIGVDVIGMTNATEAKLAREAEICYATLAIPTDYDCWHQSEEAVSVEAVIQRLVAGTTRARAVIVEALKSLGTIGTCTCGSALQGAIMTARDRMPAETLERLAPIVKKYV